MAHKVMLKYVTIKYNKVDVYIYSVDIEIIHIKKQNFKM